MVTYWPSHVGSNVKYCMTIAAPKPTPYSIGARVWPGLAKLSEECGELIQVLSKIIAIQGEESYDHWDGTNMITRLEEELGDVLAAMHYFGVENSALNLDNIAKRKAMKVERFTFWHNGGQGLPDATIS